MKPTISLRLLALILCSNCSNTFNKVLTSTWRHTVKLLFATSGITSACWKCSTDGRSISLAATIRPPLHPHPHPHQPLSHHYQLAMLVLPQCFFFVELRQANANNIWLKKNECTYQLHPKNLMWDSKTAPERVPWDSIWYAPDVRHHKWQMIGQPQLQCRRGFELHIRWTPAKFKFTLSTPCVGSYWLHTYFNSCVY